MASIRTSQEASPYEWAGIVKMPSYVVLLSSLGGIAVFGVNGFVIGPLLAVLFLSAWEMYLQVKEAHQDAASS